jgi:hypothetical protein
VCLALFECFAQLRPHIKLEDLVGTTKDTVTTTVTKSGDSTVKTESVVTPARGSSRRFFKAA